MTIQKLVILLSLLWLVPFCFYLRGWEVEQIEGIRYRLTQRQYAGLIAFGKTSFWYVLWMLFIFPAFAIVGFCAGFLEEIGWLTE